MKTFKKYTLISILLVQIKVFSFSANPVDEDKLFVFSKQSSIPVAYSLDDLNKITFSETGVKLWNTNWPTEYVYDSFSVITFNENKQSNDIKQIPVNDSNVSIVFDRSRNMICVKSEVLLSSVSVYDLQGRPVVKDYRSAYSYEMDISSMSSGIFIIRVNGGGSVVSQKIIK